MFKKKKDDNIGAKVDALKTREVFEEKTSVSKLSLPVASKSEGHTAEDIRLIIKEWLEQTHIKMKTRLNKRQVRAVTTFQGLANKYKIKTIDDYLIEFRINKLSEDGMSSKELVEILKARIPELQEDNALSKLNRFLE